jgi:hypothetical protein
MSKSPYVYMIMALTYLSYFAVLHPGYKMLCSDFAWRYEVPGKKRIGCSAVL